MREPTQDEQAAIDEWEKGGEWDYVDNHRIARLDNPQEVEEYHKAQAEGCCGFEDVELETKDGIKFLYGFNYGH